MTPSGMVPLTTQHWKNVEDGSYDVWYDHAVMMDQARYAQVG